MDATAWTDLLDGLMWAFGTIIAWAITLVWVAGIAAALISGIQEIISRLRRS